MIQKGLGFIESGLNESDIFYSAQNIGIPDKYELKGQLPVYDQGSKGSCVSCAVAEMFHFYCKWNLKKSDIGFEYVYNRRSNKKIDGMTPREALEILKSECRIETFARVTSIDSLKKSVLVNGAVLIGMKMYSYNRDFWNGEKLIGGHAVAVVGYDDEGFIIKNSWGREFGTGGYAILPYNQFDKVREAWTILS